MDQVLQFLSDELNQYLKQRFGLTEDRTYVGRLISQDGTSPLANQNKLVLSFVGLSHEKTMGSYDTRMGFASSGVRKNQDPLYYSLDIAFTAVFDNEIEGLKFLNTVVEFFHQNAHFDRSGNLAVPENIEKITLEANNLSLQDSDALWSAIGAKAMPTVLYKARVISTNLAFTKDVIPSVQNDQPKNG